MSKFWDKFLEHLTHLSVSSLIGLLLGCIGTILLNIKDPLKKIATQVIYYDTNQTIILTFLILLVVTIILLSFLSYYFYKKQKEKLKPYFGIFWDNNANPYCTVCNIPLSYSTKEKMDSCYIYCPKCKKKFPIHGNFGHVLNIEKVQEYIKKPTKINFEKYIQSQYPENYQPSHLWDGKGIQKNI
jgi:uncharacterized protein YbaR (Trm112 family)